VVGLASQEKKVRRYLYICFDTIPACDRHATASRGKNWTLTPKLGLVILARCSFAVLAQKCFNMVTCTISVFLPIKTWIFWYIGLSQSEFKKFTGTYALIPAFPLVRRVYGNAVVAQKYLRERSSPAFSNHYTPGY